MEKKVIEPSRFIGAYQGEPPWNIPAPQPALVAVAERISGRLLDSGCGTGENALFFATRGCEVTGFDLIPRAIELAKQKAGERKLSAEFLVKDALTLADDPSSAWNERFDNIIDSGVFHVFSDHDLSCYLQGLHRVLKPGGHYFMICFSDAEPGTHGPRRISRQMIEESLRDGWAIESIEPSRYQVRPEANGEVFSAGGPKAWFAVVRKPKRE